MIQFEPIKSTNLLEASFNANEKKMLVRFRGGGLYEYDVTPEEYAEFAKTFQTEESSGKHFHKNFRTRAFRKV